MAAGRGRRQACWRGALAALAAVTGGPVGAAAGADARVAVAANFRDAAAEVRAAFEASTPHTARLSFGSTGQLYAQIAQGAPYDALLAADRERPCKAVEDGWAVPGSRFTYAIGRLVLFSGDRALVRGPETLTTAEISRLAIAEPAVAPYGVAALEVLRALGRYELLRGKLVRGLNVSQALQFVHTGNADLGFVALAQIVRRPGGSRWIVPAALHSPIAQDAVLLRRGADNAAARAFLAYLRSPRAGEVLARYGYSLGAIGE